MAIAINVSNRPQSQLPDTQVFVEQETSTTPSPQNGYFQRIVETDDGVINPKNLRARTVINYGTTGAEWAEGGRQARCRVSAPGDRSRFCNHAPERAAGSPLRIRRRRASAFHVRATCI